MKKSAPYADPRARQVQCIAEMANQGSEPTSELIEACRDLNAAVARWARRAGFDPVNEDMAVEPPKELA